MNPDLWMSEAQRLRERGEAFALVTVLKAIAPTSAKPGAVAKPGAAHARNPGAKG